MNLKEIGLSQQVWDQLRSIGKQKEAPPLETVEMTLRNYFGMPVPDKWKIDSWIQSGVYISITTLFEKTIRFLSKYDSPFYYLSVSIEYDLFNVRDF